MRALGAPVGDLVGEDGASAVLFIDLDGVAANWAALAARVAPAECAAVVKADAYGLGVGRIAPVLWDAGCRTFFVAILEEALVLRALLPGAAIHVLDGPIAGTETLYAARGIVPVINDLGQLEAWRREAGRREAGRRGAALPLCLQVDTGMARFGLPGDEVARLAAEPELVSGLAPALLMSHLACADQPRHPANEGQRRRFEAAGAVLAPVLGTVRRSLAASSGVFLGKPFHHGLVRPGAALFGVPPTSGVPNPMRPVVTLRARVMQVRTIGAGESVGYGATFTAERTMRIATIATGYADGFLRAGSNRGSVSAFGRLLPIVGLVSMDSITVDASAVGERLRVGDAVELIGPDRPLEDVARDAGTIGYEILTSLGGRYLRRDLPVRSAMRRMPG